MLDLRGRFLLADDDLCRLTGRRWDELASLRLADVLGPENGPEVERWLRLGAIADETMHAWCHRPDGSAVNVSVRATRATSAEGVIQTIVVRLEAREVAVEPRGPARVAGPALIALDELGAHLDLALGYALRTETFVAVLEIDEHGPGAAPAVLGTCRASDTVGHADGRFLVVCDNLRSADDAVHVAHRMADALADATLGGTVSMLVSDGMAVVSARVIGPPEG